jgi:hypothetical protein
MKHVGDKPLVAGGSNDDIFTIDELIKRRALELQQLPLLCYPEAGLTDHEEHSAEAIDRYVDAATAVLQRRGLQPVVSGTLRQNGRCD